MTGWVRLKSILFPQNALELPLYKVIKQNKVFDEEFSVDMSFKKYGQNVLRLFAFHTELYPIKPLWGCVKKSIAVRSVSFLYEEI